MKAIVKTLVFFCCLCVAVVGYAANESKRLCVYDFLGKSGVLSVHMLNFKVAMAKYYNIELYTYKSAVLLRQDFDNKRCDMMYTWGLDVGNYNALTGSFEALGMLKQTNTALKLARAVMAEPKWLQGPKAQVLGIYPVGNVYFITNNKQIDRIDALIDTPIGVLDDEVLQALAKHIGAKPVLGDLPSLVSNFKSGKTPVTAATALTAEAFFTPGSYYLLPDALFNISMQLLVHNKATSLAFNKAALDWSLANMAYLARQNAASTRRLPANVWLQLDKSNQLKHDKIMRDIRLSMRKSGYYHPQLLKLAKSLRCNGGQTHYDCLLADE